MKRFLQRLSLLLAVLLLLTTAVFADFGPKPQLVVRVEQPPQEEYYLDLLDTGDWAKNLYDLDERELDPALLAALVNLAFNHEGATILAYLPSGNPLTLESIAYGFAAAAMLAAVVLWFSCWNTVMTSDKLMHLFGRVVPALSLLLSMTLRFVPRFQAKLREVTAARRGMGLYAEKGRLQKLKSAVTVFSVMVTWSLENAVETADSMKSRGYGLPGRTAFSLYRYSRRDRLLLLWLTLCGTYIAAGWALGGVKWRYYPTARGVLTPYSASVLLAYFLLCLTPVLLQRKEARTWSSIASKT